LQEKVLADAAEAMRVAAALVKPIAPMKLSIKKAGAAAGSKLNKPIFGDDDEEAKRPKLAKMTYTDVRPFARSPPCDAWHGLE
jgi:hypothetical protein